MIDISKSTSTVDLRSVIIKSLSVSIPSFECIYVQYRPAIIPINSDEDYGNLINQTGKPSRGFINVVKE